MTSSVTNSGPIASGATVRGALIPILLISLGVVGIENALTRYFAVSAWSEYGYWIISIVMACAPSCPGP